MSFASKWSLAVAAAAAALTALFGGCDAWLQALVTVLALDYATGLAAAWCTGELSSRTGARGLAKKLGVLCLAALGAQLDALLGAGGAVRGMVLGFYVANDALSILENAARMGVPVPEALKSRLAQLKGGPHG